MNYGNNQNNQNNNQNYQNNQNNQNNNQYRPNLQILNKGYGIDQNEYNTITNSCINAYTSKSNPMSTSASNGIKNQIGGEWFVCVSPVGTKDYDFSITSARNDDNLVFSVENVLFQVCRLK